MPRQKNVSPGIYAYSTEAGKRWGAVYYASPDWVTGKRRQKRKQGFATKAEAMAWRVANLNERNRGADGFEPSREPLGNYLEHWLDGRLDISAQTKRMYRNWLRPIRATIGHVPLSQVTPRVIETAFGQMRRAGSSLIGIRSSRRVLSQALRHATRIDLLLRNPVERVPAPKPIEHKAQTWTPDQMRAFLANSRDDPVWGDLWRVLAVTWIRFGEAAALTWGDIDFATHTLHITKTTKQNEAKIVMTGTPKTAHSTRTIALSDVMIGILRTRRQFAFDPTDTGLIFPGVRSGSFLNNASANNALRRACRKAGVPEITPHELRHNGGSVAFMNGIDIKVISERMGHASVKLTYDLYTHLSDAHHRAAARQIAAVLEDE